MSQHSNIITGIGHYHPTHFIENEFFEALDIDSQGEWIKDRTGIESRFSVLSKDEIRSLRAGTIDIPNMFRQKRIQSIAELAEPAWNQAKERLNDLNPDLLILGTSVPDFDIPANASTIAHKLNLSCTVFDVNSACSSFIVDLQVADSLLKQDLYKQAAVFNVERYSIRLDYSDKRSCILFGDGSSCAILNRNKGKSRGFKIIDTQVLSEPKDYEAVIIPEGQNFSQNGSKVQRFAISKTCEIADNICKRNNLSLNKDINYFIGHQANLRMLQSAVSKMGLKEEQHLYNVNRYGNQGGAGAPIVLSQHWDKFKSGDTLVIAVVGSGLTWGAALLEWV